MTGKDSAFVLDGNAAAGLLQEFFIADVTTAQIWMRFMRFDRGGGFIASVCGAHGGSSRVCQLRWHSHPGGPYTAWPLASDARYTLSEVSAISER